jgi:hypothetical protein
MERIRYSVGNGQFYRSKRFSDKNSGIGLKEDGKNDKCHAPEQMLGVTKEIGIEVE